MAKRAGLFALVLSLTLVSQNRAEVVLANTNTANGSTKVDFNIRMTASSISLLRAISTLKLFGDTGQTISATFGWYSFPSVGTKILTGVENGTTGQYNFDLAQLTMPPEDLYTNYYLEVRSISASGTGFYTVTNSSSTYAAPGYTLTGYNGANIRFEMSTSAPEPGTLILGGIAAACGGAGVWWRKRKNKGNDPVRDEAEAVSL